MDLDQYQDEARRTAPRTLDAYPAAIRKVYLSCEGTEQSLALLKIFDVLIWGQGLAGESGEVCDLLKKVHGHGQPYYADKMLKELGDVLWYLANLADAHGFTLSQVAKANVNKLRARYPQGFTVAEAAAKADERPAKCICPAGVYCWDCPTHGHPEHKKAIKKWESAVDHVREHARRCVVRCGVGLDANGTPVPSTREPGDVCDEDCVPGGGICRAFTDCKNRRDTEWSDRE